MTFVLCAAACHTGPLSCEALRHSRDYPCQACALFQHTLACMDVPGPPPPSPAHRSGYTIQMPACCAGFVAVSDAKKKKDIAVVFRGTQTPNEWLSNITAFMTGWDQAAQESVTAGNGKSMQSGVYVEQVRGCLAGEYSSRKGTGFHA